MSFQADPPSEQTSPPRKRKPTAGSAAEGYCHALTVIASDGGRDYHRTARSLAALGMMPLQRHRNQSTPRGFIGLLVEGTTRMEPIPDVAPAELALDTSAIHL